MMSIFTLIMTIGFIGLCIEFIDIILNEYIDLLFLHEIKHKKLAKIIISFVVITLFIIVYSL